MTNITTTGITTTGITTSDGISLHVESTGHSTPLLFLHEFAGDHRSWERRSGTSRRATAA
jgi:pimeloyl-ACP methyl ester carboxylesterase